MSSDDGYGGAAERTGATSTRPVPEFEIEQYFPERGEEHSDRKRREIRQKYGNLRGYFRLRSQEYSDLQRWLNQAHFGEKFDEYLVRGVWYAIAGGAFGTFLGLLLAVQLSGRELALAIRSPVALPESVATVVAGHETLLLQVGLVAGAGGLSAAATYFGHYYYPRLVVNSRRRNINLLLPHAIVYMYALSYGGQRPFRVVEEMADAEDTYGEVAAEFGIVVNEVEMFGNDLVTAIQNTRNTTPNENLEQFLDDMLGVLEGGGSLTDFLEEETRVYRKRARQEQSEFLETLEVLSELFVVAFVAAPLFLVVTLVLVGLMGGGVLPVTRVLVYGALPLGMVGFLLVIHYLSLPFSAVTGIEIDGADRTVEVAPSTALLETDEYDRYQFQKIQRLLAELLRDPLDAVQSRSIFLSLAFTLPLAAGLVLAVVHSDDGPLGALYEADPIGTTTALVVVPLLMVALPLAVLYELQRRRIIRIASRFPDTLNLLASANQMGIPLTDALDLVSQWSDGPIAAEFRKTYNDIQWNHNVQAALLALGERLGVPQIKRTMRLLATGSYSTSDLSRVLSIAAEDTRIRHELERSRRAAMKTYILIVAIGFFVYLGVIVLLDLNYLTPIAQLSEQTAAMDTGGGGVMQAISVSTVPVQEYRTLFFHSTLIQGTGSGLLAGKLAENDLLAGVKYAIALVAVATVIFVWV